MLGPAGTGKTRPDWTSHNLNRARSDLVKRTAKSLRNCGRHLDREGLVALHPFILGRFHRGEGRLGPNQGHGRQGAQLFSLWRGRALGLWPGFKGGQNEDEWPKNSV